MALVNRCEVPQTEIVIPVGGEMIRLKLKHREFELRNVTKLEIVAAIAILLTLAAVGRSLGL